MKIKKLISSASFIALGAMSAQAEEAVAEVKKMAQDTVVASAKVELKAKAATFADDTAFMLKHTDIVLLKNGDAAVAVAPAYQGRVMTSTHDAKAGTSYGWINRPVIEKGVVSAEEEKGTILEKIYIFGGEERFWIGPEGGQFAYFFAPGKDFTVENWSTPAYIDTDVYAVKDKSDKHVTFTHAIDTKNQSGSSFKMGIERKIEILDNKTMASNLSVEFGDSIKGVGYQSTNTLTNTGESAWTPETGMPSIWLLGMYAATEKTNIAIPIKDGKGPKVNDYNFFDGKPVPAGRLKATEKHVFMKGDAGFRGKIGVTAHRSMEIAGSYDAMGKVLTIVTYGAQEAKSGYVNSKWELQEEPFAGDVINAYNDGPTEPGSAEQLGKFYELETSSPAAALKPKEAMTHKQQTYHFHGNEADLEELSKKLLKAKLSEITEAL